MAHDFQNFSVHYRILQSLPSPIRTSWVGRKYWQWVVMGDHAHIHCNPNDGLCLYCEREKELALSDKVYYTLERWFS